MTPLPIDSFLPQITQSLREHGSLVLVAEPGAGKTTRVPPALLAARLFDGALVMLQPRRVAARAAAERIASEQRVTLGNEVGYQIRFEKRITAATRLRVLTEGILTRQLIDDPELRGIGCVVLDEFHERSIHIDLCLALLREVQRELRPELKIVVMSATLQAEPVAAFLGVAPIVRVPGRTFPIDIRYAPPGGRLMLDHITQQIESLASTAGTGDTLVFLPGAGEIARVSEMVRLPSDCEIVPLHGSMKFEDQQRALQPSRGRKFILSTNIAETSLTIEGVTHVIDSGQSRVPRFDPQRGLDRLEIDTISQASATQRAGRAGRTGPGMCVRCWTPQEQLALPPQELPEIRRVDLSSTLLDLLAWGVSAEAFAWFEPPDPIAIATGLRLLESLNAIEGNRLTPLGKAMQALPVHPRLARVLIGGVASGHARLAASAAALLSERDIYRGDRFERSPTRLLDNDLTLRLQLLDSPDAQTDPIARRSVLKVRDDLLRICDTLRPPRDTRLDGDDADTVLAKLLLLAYADRICKRREIGSSRLLMTGNIGVRLHPTSAVHGGELLVALDVRSGNDFRNESTIFQACRIEREWLERLLPQQVHKLDSQELEGDRVVGVRLEMYRDLLLEKKRGTRVDPIAAGELLLAELSAQIDSLFEQVPSLAILAKRLQLLAAFLPPHLREVGEHALDLHALLAQACANQTSIADVRRNLANLGEASLSHAQRRALREYAPMEISVPTGSQIKLDYSPSSVTPPRGPVLAVRLQELFGLPATPRICGGQLPVTLHLLSPNYKPVQVTDDLASFWKNTYPQVRKDLRARYSKHSWPDDPMEALAIRGTKKQNNMR